MIPQDAIEALARRNFEHNYDEITWAELPADPRQGWLEEAQAQCEAAAPYLRAQALLDAADELTSGTQDVPGNDYISTGLSDAALWHEVRSWLRARAVTERGEG